MRRFTALACLSLSPWLPFCTAQTPPPALHEFVAGSCLDCHGGATVKGKLDLGKPAGDPAADLWRWRRLRDRVAAGEMPPADAEQPAPAAKAAFVQSVDELLRTAVPRLPADAGRTTIRRLSRSQWENCVRDLFGVQLPTAGFPADDLGYGFDTIGDALTFSTLHLEKYLAAASAVANQVFEGDDGRSSTRRFEAEGLPVVAGALVRQDGDMARCYTSAELALEVQLPRAGRYRLRAIAAADPAGTEAAKLVVRAEQRVLATFVVGERQPTTFATIVELPGGGSRLSLEFPNDFHDPRHPDPKRRDRNLHIDAIEIEGPLDPRVVPQAQAWVHAATPAKGTPQQRLQALAATVLPRIWRRPCSPEEAAALARAGADLVGSGQPFLSAQRFVLASALVSPNFLFRVEPGAGAPGSALAPLPPAALAARLSFFLWASTPDEALRERAAAGRLADPQALQAEVDRLLADPRAEALATDFAAQWLELRSLAERTPDPSRFPGFDDALRAAMRRETELLFLAVLRERLPVEALLLSDFTHVDATLARFYGLPPPAAPGFVRTPLPAAARERGGLLGHASVLAVTSNPTRTSPVKRGKWVLENLLGQPPPPPPPGNDSLANEAAIDSSRSFREQLSQHRQRAGCAACHLRMDALGFAFEHYDAIGRHRIADGGGPIDCSGELPDGTELAGLDDLRRLVAADPAFAETIAHKLFLYAVGRDLRPIDRLRLDHAVGELRRSGAITLRGLIGVVVADDAFRQRGSGR